MLEGSRGLLGSIVCGVREATSYHSSGPAPHLEPDPASKAPLLDGSLGAPPSGDPPCETLNEFFRISMRPSKTAEHYGPVEDAATFKLTSEGLNAGSLSLPH